ncbi:MAG: hypothetical protein A7316_07965 [Candidatus Altiarchaeales archaeon WOR_SM1_86-2]|nr:MAG: hypothetical protein A7316_07965 [Candidatus Altiarchaeales archaeon WOR_SM1_86-2]
MDNLCKEAPSNYKSYHPDKNDVDKINKARSKAFIHLFLKVKFGLLNFHERHKYITDNPGDAGIDAYFIDRELKIIYFIQSKFRANKQNFEEKKIKIEELLAMEIDRVLEGYNSYENGKRFNSKILNMINEIKAIDDIGRYRYDVIILANVKEIVQSKLRRLFGYPTQIFNFERTYMDLLFPLLTGSYYNIPDLNIYINISDKSSGSKISYQVETSKGKCEITVVFVPLEEIAQLMLKYRNSILKFNPRCYLDLSGSPINREIHNTIISQQTNEFALYNNGITMLSDDTSFNERIGQRDKAVLCVKNPQIINGGQTAYSLARIYEKNLNSPDKLQQIFLGKEVLLKVITFVDEIVLDSKLELIEEISNATNQQNVVTYADRHSNDKIQHELQDLLFNDFGILYERKRGEFSDGIKSDYIDESVILPRNVFVSVALACQGRHTKPRKIFKKPQSYNNIFNTKDYDNYKIGLQVYYFLEDKYSSEKLKKSKNILKYGFQALLFIVILKYRELKKPHIDKDLIFQISDYIISKSEEFEEYAIKLRSNRMFFRTIKTNKIERTITNFYKYYTSINAKNDLRKYFEKIPKV